MQAMKPMPARSRLPWILPICAAAGLMGQAAPAQTPDPNLTFEAAVLRPSGPRSSDSPAGGRPVGGPGTSSPGRVSYPRFLLQQLLMQAFGVQLDQISGPDWLSAERFDITANIRRGATAEEVNVMLQNLLTERFKLALHHATKDGEVYQIGLAKGGSKLKEALPLAKGERQGMEASSVNGTQRKKCRACSISDLVRGVSGTGIRIVDKTGLTGKYDFSLEYVASLVPGPSPKLSALQIQGNAGPDLILALEQQLGLKLEKGRAAVDLLVIDHIEKTPADN